ncbi:hypothetical protein MNBD_GAMMA15-2026 [hydrothermal vent metagenome]|uniref:Uncharacterized protein n=1 Tax=hydrothermal vent metagenome TaxID=652676 RepID=A0A3B0YEJ5_9ZZZZ
MRTDSNLNLKKEIISLRKDENIEMIEEDALAYAVQTPRDSPANSMSELLVENAPGALAEV